MKILTAFFRRSAPSYRFSTLVNRHKTLVINQNLRFDAKEYDLFVIPSHPRIAATGMNSMQIDTSVPVLQLAFVGKSSEENFTSLWDSKGLFKLKFNQLQAIIDLEVNSGLSTKIQIKSQYKKITYDFTDVKQKKEIRFSNQQDNLEQDNNQQKHIFFAELPYSQFQLLQDIIKESLYDLSGLRFSFESRKNDEISLIRRQLNKLKQKSEQVKTFYKQ